MQDGAINAMTSHLSADIDGTSFSWEGPFPSEEFGGDMTDFAADSDARLELCGFPLMHSTEFVEQQDCAPPELALNPEDGTYQELLERANRIDVATDMSLTVVSGTREHREEEYSVWGFYTEGEFDEEGLRAVKEILSETPEKRPTLIAVSYTHLRAHET